MAKRITVVHFNDRRNGGNLALNSLFQNVASELKLEKFSITLKSDITSLMYIIFTKDILIWSNPLITILLFWKRKSIIFVQSQDEHLFNKADFGTLQTFGYRFLLKIAQRRSNSKLIFNSAFSMSKYRYPLLSIGIYPTVDALYHRKQKRRVPEKLQKKSRQCVWIGTHHSRKGFADLVDIATSNPSYHFVCIFSSQLPNQRKLPHNIQLMNDIPHLDVLEIISDSLITISTSKFESLNLPIYEGLIHQNIVLAKSSEYIFINGLDEYINLYENSKSVDLQKLLIKKHFETSDPTSRITKLLQKIDKFV